MDEKSLRWLQVYTEMLSENSDIRIQKRPYQTLVFHFGESKGSCGPGYGSF